MKMDDKPKEQQNELKCTCDLAMQPDQYILTPCPIHGIPAQKIASERNYGSEHAIITDSHLKNKNIEFFSGYCFKCTNCGEHSVMHYMKFCPNCGVPLMIQSDFVREIIRQMNARGRAAATSNPINSN